MGVYAHALWLYNEAESLCNVDSLGLSVASLKKIIYLCLLMKCFFLNFDYCYAKRDIFCRRLLLGYSALF